MVGLEAGMAWQKKAGGVEQELGRALGVCTSQVSNMGPTKVHCGIAGMPTHTRRQSDYVGVCM